MQHTNVRVIYGTMWISGQLYCPNRLENSFANSMLLIYLNLMLMVPDTAVSQLFETLCKARAFINHGLLFSTYPYIM
ncbi:MAG: hypothetical protein K0R84_1605 [Clostridia bacterium]|nr:hypothetical protein [Clostridia bacterium]